MTATQKIFFAIAASVLVFSWIYTFVKLSELPDQIPSHWNSAGQIDDYSSKYILLMFPIFSLALSLLFQVICKYPHNFNYSGITVTIQNAPKLYNAAKNLIRYMNCIINILFAFILVSIAEAA